MTENEFLRLGIGTVVSNRWQADIYFVIYNTDEMGTAYRGKNIWIWCQTNGLRQKFCKNRY